MNLPAPVLTTHHCLIAADWCEEQGEAEYAERLRELASVPYFHIPQPWDYRHSSYGLTSLHGRDRSCSRAASSSNQMGSSALTNRRVLGVSVTGRATTPEGA